MCTLMCHAHSLNSIFAESEMTVEGIEYSKSEQTSFIYRLRPRRPKNVSVCPQKAHINIISLSHTDTHTLWLLCVSGLHCVHCMEN